MDFSDPGTLTALAVVLIAVVAAGVVYRNRGKLTVKHGGTEVALDMGSNDAGAGQAPPAGPVDRSTHTTSHRSGLGDISDLRVGEGATIDGNINIGHQVQGPPPPTPESEEKGS